MPNEFKVRNGLIINNSGSTALEIQGAQGQLATVTDSLSGSLYSIDDISGIPVLEVISDNVVNIGTFRNEGIKVSGSFATITGSLNVTGSVTGNVLGNNTDTYTSSAAIQQVITLTQAEYNAIGSPNVNTLYVISDSIPFNPSIYATTGSNIFVGNQIITGSITATTGFTGSLLGTASYATQALTASYTLNATSASYALTSSFATTASYLNSLNQQLTITGSLRGNVTALSITSNTASLDCALNNFYTLQLVSGSNTYINPSNILPGQTINLLVSTTGSGTVSFPSIVKQVTGSAYVPTTTTSKDIVTFISYDSTNLYLANVKNLV